MKLNLGPKRDGKVSIRLESHNQSINKEQHQPGNQPQSQDPKLTKVISTKKIVSTQRYPSYSENSIQPPQKVIHQEFRGTPKQTRIVAPTVVDRRILGIPARLVMFLLIIGSVIGASIYVKNLTSTVRVTAVDFSTFNPNTQYGSWTQGQTFDLTGGNELVRGFTIQNTATAYAMDAVLVFTASSNSTLVDNDCQIQILDSDSTSGITDTTVTSGQLSVTGNYNNIAAGATRNGRWRIVCKPEFSNTLSIQLQMTPTSKFTY